MKNRTVSWNEEVLVFFFWVYRKVVEIGSVYWSYGSILLNSILQICDFIFTFEINKKINMYCFHDLFTKSFRTVLRQRRRVDTLTPNLPFLMDETPLWAHLKNRFNFPWSIFHLIYGYLSKRFTCILLVL